MSVDKRFVYPFKYKNINKSNQILLMNEFINHRELNPLQKYLMK